MTLHHCWKFNRNSEVTRRLSPAVLPMRNNLTTVLTLCLNPITHIKHSRPLTGPILKALAKVKVDTMVVLQHPAILHKAGLGLWPLVSFTTEEKQDRRRG